MRLLRTLPVLAGFAIACGNASASVGSQSFEVISTIPGTQTFSQVGPGGPPGPEAGSGASLGWTVAVDTALLNTLPLTLNVNFPDRPLTTFTRIRAERRGGSAFVWMGRSADCSGLFSVTSIGVRGTLSCLDGQYGIDHLPGSQTTRLSRYDNARLRSEEEPLPQSTTSSPVAPSSAPVGNATDTTVDVLVLFPASTSIINIWAFAQYCIDQTQLAMENSTTVGEPTISQLRLVGAARTARTTSNEVRGDLNFAQNGPEAMNLRNYWAADAVVFISTGSGLPGTPLGIGNIPGYDGEALPGPSFAPHAIAAVLSGFATQEGQYVFAHELAHTFGANHNRDHSPPNPTPLETYAFGHWARNNAKGIGNRTIMSYVQECTGHPCDRILHYSNPDVYVDWFHTGLDDTADNARVIAEVSPIQAQYRSGVGRIFADGFQ